MRFKVVKTHSHTHTHREREVDVYLPTGDGNLLKLKHFIYIHPMNPAAAAATARHILHTYFLSPTLSFMTVTTPLMNFYDSHFHSSVLLAATMERVTHRKY